MTKRIEENTIHEKRFNEIYEQVKKIRMPSHWESN